MKIKEKKFREEEEKESKKIFEKNKFSNSIRWWHLSMKISEMKLKKFIFGLLDLDVKMLYKRVKESKKRPLLKNSSEEELIKIYNLRKKFTWLILKFSVVLKIKNR